MIEPAYFLLGAVVGAFIAAAAYADDLAKMKAAHEKEKKKGGRQKPPRIP
jgi:hypothetical protein